MRYRALVFVLALVIACGTAANAFAWSNGANWGNGFGTHDWLLYEAKRLCGSPSWLNLSYALPYTDNPDMVTRNFYYHVYDIWGDSYGNSPAKVEEYYDRAVLAYADGDYRLASKWVAYMSHYYTDTVNPLHTDQTDAEKSMHSNWERATDTRLNSKGEHRSWLSDDGFQSVSSPRTKAVRGAEYAHQYYGSLVKNYNDHSYNSAVTTITRRCANKAANGLADLIQQIPKDAR